MGLRRLVNHRIVTQWHDTALQRHHNRGSVSKPVINSLRQRESWAFSRRVSSRWPFRIEVELLPSRPRTGGSLDIRSNQIWRVRSGAVVL